MLQQLVVAVVVVVAFVVVVLVVSVALRHQLLQMQAVLHQHACKARTSAYLSSLTHNGTSSVLYYSDFSNGS
jgi:hypothetical protein